MVGVSSLFCGAAQAGNIDNLRFVDKDLNVTIIGPGQPAPGLIQGDLVGEVEFQSDLRDVNTGEFSYGDMTALWAFETPDLGYVTLNNPDVDGYEWHGALGGQDVSVIAFDPVSGIGTARVTIAVGDHGNPQAPLGTPHLPEDSDFEIVLGWESSLGLDMAGNPMNTLAHAESPLAADWPDVYFIEAHSAPSQFEIGPGFQEMWLCVSETSPFARTFDLTVQPATRAELGATIVTLPAGEFTVPITIRGLEKGKARVTAREGGALVGRSDRIPVTIDGAPEFEEWATAGAGGEVGGSAGAFSADKKCVRGFYVHGPDEPVRNYCFPEKKEPNPAPQCVGENTDGEPDGHVYWHYPDECKGDPGNCLTSAVKPASDYYFYRFHSKEKYTTSRRSWDVSSKPFGVGGGTTATAFYSTWCCKYVYDDSREPGNKGGAEVICR